MSPEPLLLPARDSAARAARRHVAVACQHLAPPLLDTAVLLASGLVTNAVTHSAGGILQVRCDPHLLRIEVTDRYPAAPQLASTNHHAEHRRGLQLVAALASRWGTSSNPLGKTVWAELDYDTPGRGG